MKKLWLLVVLLQLAGDATLVLAARGVREWLPWLDVRITRPVPDSPRRSLSRYLHDSLGVVTTRQGDTLIVRIPPHAERAIDAATDSLRFSSRRVALKLGAAVVLLHTPLLIAIGVGIAHLADRVSRRRNHARDAWDDS